MMPSQVTLVEVGPRDGLQNEAQPVSAAHKIELVQRLQAAGCREIEVTSFVSPKWVPQMADNAEVLAGIRRAPGVRYSVLVPNLKGLEAALAHILACLELGLHTFDTSVAGLGGCPYAKGATGNVASEDVLFMLRGLGIETGIDLDRLVDAGGFISDVLGRPPVSRAGKALLTKRGKVFASVIRLRCGGSRA